MTDISLKIKNTSAWRLSALLERMVVRLGGKFLPDALSGVVQITLPTGNTIVIGGQQPGGDADLTVRRWYALARAALGGSNGFAEAYMRGELTSTDLVPFFRFIIANLEPLMASGGNKFGYVNADRLRHLSRDNNRVGSRRNIAAHYDLSNAFFSMWLDKTMTYSAALYEGPDMTLEQAQQRKYDRVIEALDLPERASVLEIGCGWGGFAARLLQQQSGNAYTGITLSREQLHYAETREDLANRRNDTDFRYQDYRDVTGQFDGIASIEMIEAVGEKHWPDYFKTLFDRLKPGRSAVIQAITISPTIYDRYRRGADFIQTYIFPGGMLPTAELVDQHAREAGLTVEPLESFGRDYARTLKTWRETFEARWPDIRALGFDHRFRRMWRFYLTYCEAGFEEDLIDVQLFRFTRPSSADA